MSGTQTLFLLPAPLQRQKFHPDQGGMTFLFCNPLLLAPFWDLLPQINGSLLQDHSLVRGILWPWEDNMLLPVSAEGQTYRASASRHEKSSTFGAHPGLREAEQFHIQNGSQVGTLALFGAGWLASLYLRSAHFSAFPHRASHTKPAKLRTMDLSGSGFCCLALLQPQGVASGTAASALSTQRRVSPLLPLWSLSLGLF